MFIPSTSARMRASLLLLSLIAALPLIPFVVFKEKTNLARRRDYRQMLPTALLILVDGDILTLNSLWRFAWWALL